MSAERAGTLVQRVIEIETYRTLALLGLPEAQRLAPSIAACERRLAEVTDEMRHGGDLPSNHRLLDQLTGLAAEVEAGAAASAFRFGASRAYEQIVELRLQSTVEGLSVAAITYYVVSLFGYFAKAAHDSGRFEVEPSIATAAFVPIAALAIWWTIRNIRKKHVAGEE